MNQWAQKIGGMHQREWECSLTSLDVRVSMKVEVSGDDRANCTPNVMCFCGGMQRDSQCRWACQATDRLRYQMVNPDWCWVTEKDGKIWVKEEDWGETRGETRLLIMRELWKGGEKKWHNQMAWASKQ